MSETWFMRKPCAHCPFRVDVTPFLHPDRAEEISSLTWNKYNAFPCHKTVDYDDCDDGEGEVTADSLTCAGFLTMQINESGMDCPGGFEPAENVYSEPSDMVFAYTEEWERQHEDR